MTARTKLTALALACAAGLLGAHAPGDAFASPPAPHATGQLERDWVRGALWLPAGSDATRPVLRLAPVAWSPSGTTLAAKD
jgi:hypothetical protein